MGDYFYWRYRLKLAGPGDLNPVTPGGEIEGVLLRHRDGGHACLQPWPSLGHADLDHQMALLRDGGDSSLISSCRRCIGLDRAARADGRSVFSEITVPQSHLTVPDWAELGWLEEKFSSGHHIFKLKCGLDLAADSTRVRTLVERFGHGLILRIDFNESLEAPRYSDFLKSLGTAAAQVDFVEDPVPYDPPVWREIAAQTAVDLAVDRASTTAIDGFAVRIIKPAWEQIPAGSPGRKILTSAMDHPLGQLFAACEAAGAGIADGDCGLLTHWLFEPNPFSEMLGVEEQRLVAPPGTGLGFDDLLEQLPWKAL